MSIVVGYADTAHGRAALEEAGRQARLRTTPLHVVAYLSQEAGDNPARAQEQHEAVDELRRELEATVQPLHDADVEVTTEVVHGPQARPTEALLDAAERAEAELLVIGMRRRSPVGKLVLGSVVQEVLLSAKCPVLAVKAPAEAERS